ncbi:MAG: hypothetical protein Q9169_006288 [Polycauliona sp. 2 TL-2023]
MAEILFDEEDDDFWIEEPYDEADNLAEHTMQSPVLINYDPTLDLDGEAEDWEDWSSVDGDFFDQETIRKKRRRLNHPTKPKHVSPSPSTQPHAASIKALPGISLGLPVFPSEDNAIRDLSIVKWKVRHSSPRAPFLEPGQEEKVSILKDWKERFKPPPSTEKKDKASPSNGTQRAIAVVIETRKSPSVSNGIKSKGSLEEPAAMATTTLSHRNKVSNSSQNGNTSGSFPITKNGFTATRKRKLSPSPEAGLEPVPKRQSARNTDAVSQQKVESKAGPKRKARDQHEETHPQSKRVKAKVSDDASTRKENVRPTTSDSAASKQENVHSKPSASAAGKDKNKSMKPSENAATNNTNSRPKAAAVGRRSTRQK